MAPFTQAMIENLGGQNLPLNDWKQIARACLSGGDIRPYIPPNLPINLWGRDVMTHMGVYLYSPSEQVSNQLLDQGLLPTSRLGKNNQENITPIQPRTLPGKSGLGYF